MHILFSLQNLPCWIPSAVCNEHYRYSSLPANIVSTIILFSTGPEEQMEQYILFIYVFTSHPIHFHMWVDISLKLAGNSF